MLTFGNYRPCRACGDEGEQVWIETTPGARTAGLCTDCALVARGLAKGATMVTYDQYDEIRPQLAAESVEANEQIELLKDFAIDSQDELEAFAGELAKVKGRWKRLDEGEKKVTRPINAGLKALRALFAGPKEHWAALEARIKDLIADYTTRIASDNASLLEAAQSEAANGNADGARAALAEVGAVEKVEGLSTREVWDFEVTNVAILPTAFVVPNPAAIRVEMQTQAKLGGTPAIAGVRFFKKVQVASKAV